MSDRAPDHGFFVGYFKKVPPAVARFALLTGIVIAGLLLGASLTLALATPDAGSGRYESLPGAERIEGVLDRLPYPILRTPRTETAPARAILLGEQTKVGFAADSEASPDSIVKLGGVFVKRGDLDMLLVGDLSRDLVDPEKPMAPFRPAPPEPLGRWRLAGEICDGKCYAGAMKPGSGLAHKACANLCILGGLPPVLVMARPVEGSTVVLLAGADGGPLPDAMLDLMALPVEIDGRLERRDDLLIFYVDAATAKVI